MKFDDCYFEVSFNNGVTLNVFLEDLREIYNCLDFVDEDDVYIYKVLVKEKVS